ncbi:DUF2927 domain-containing protein [Jannaschia seohaensis]|uniref:DUF2927 family protein n=1 Tax=Jannaschia seohaensis TaxID=475081 RepID=A0A2Y9AR13_9RHOB|nr:DUF2927 domain-containing protein [Jannaschia seohaensis]PWJ18299.1 Protein of unknown function (DUF2927) [Jannaschia seohaensis]SSA46824.1 Protein of unknown function [Jannaschia seohaensis]
MRVAAALAMLLLTACQTTGDVVPPTPLPEAPAPPQPQTAMPARPAVISEESNSARVFYRRLEQRRLTEGLMRRDGGGIDARFDAEDLARNFERIAFRSELSFSGGGMSTHGGTRAAGLTRWERPIRMQLHFGESVDGRMRAQERSRISAYAARLRRLTGHPITIVGSRGNFHVFVSDIEEQPRLGPRLREVLGPDMVRRAVTVAALGRQVYCAVLSWPSREKDFVNATTVVFVRTELPDLSRQACYHEEIAQGMGLGNDSDEARPSIFNDDDEFALLTTMDEHMLRILYDPRLRPGMSADQARPIVRRIARELVPSPG